MSRLLTLLFVLCFSTLFAQVPPPPPLDSARGAENIVFSKVEQEAQYPGGVSAWGTYLQRNLNPNVPVDAGAPSGKYTVIVKFIVSRDGTISDVMAETDLGYGMEAEVLRIIKRSGPWIPAYQNKRKVNAYRRQPVTFLVEDEAFSITSQVPYTLFTGVNTVKIDAGKKHNPYLKLSISNGSINPTDDEGEYTIRVNQTGRVIISLYNSKTNKKIGDASFEVKKAGS